MYKVMLVDDEPWALLGLKECYPWQQNGYQIIFETTEPFKAFEYIKTEKPDIIFTDIKMYGMSGLDLIKKTLDAGMNIEFVIVSGYSDFKYAQEAIEYGVFHYLLKPIEEHEVYLMMEKLTRLLDKKAANPDTDTARNASIQSNSGDAKNIFINLLKYINSNYAEDINLNHLSRKFFLHSTYISDLFKKNLGINFSNYVTELRLKKACSLLIQTGYPIIEIALISGFKDYSYFSRVFKEHFHVTPVQYRKSYNSKPR